MADQPVVLIPYDPQWPRMFEQERTALLAAVGDRDVTCAHIGSTAIPGLAAKPIIDILIEATALPTPRPPSWTSLDPTGSADLSSVLAVSDYVPTYDDGGKAFYKKAQPRINLWVYLAGDNRAKDLILFRDYLREHTSHTREYEKLKRGLALKHPDDASAYALAKLPFVRRTLSLARAWASWPIT